MLGVCPQPRHSPYPEFARNPNTAHTRSLPATQTQPIPGVCPQPKNTAHTRSLPATQTQPIPGVCPQPKHSPYPEFARNPDTAHTRSLPATQTQPIPTDPTAKSLSSFRELSIRRTIRCSCVLAEPWAVILKTVDPPCCWVFPPPHRK